MTYDELIRTLGHELGCELNFSPQGTCRVALDDDIVDFEKANEKLYIMADIGSCEKREDAYFAFLAANHLGLKTGGASIGIDIARSVFTLTLIEGEVSFETFNADLTRFVQVLRWWKEWLALPPLEETAPEARPSLFEMDMIKI